MKKIILVLAVLVMAPFIAEAKEGDVAEVVIGVNDAYIPSGFDSNSDAFVVVSGLFPNSCYHWKSANVKHVGPLLHEVKSSAFVIEGMCIMVLVPFQKEVQLGKLAVGEHSIRFVNGDGTYWEKRLTIEQ